MRSEEKQKGGFYIKNPPFPLFYPLSYYAAPYLIALTNALLRLCCSVLKYSHCACTLPFSSSSGLLSANTKPNF